jgi:hypothetical protein
VTLFEYLAAANTLILSFAVARIIGGLAAAFAPARRYWIHLALITALSMTIATWFWGFWSFRAVEWTFARFLVVLMPAVTLQFLAATLIPSSPDQVESWREFYFSVRLWYFGGWIALALILAVAPTILVDLPIIHRARAGQVALLLLGAIGFYSDSPRVHAGLAVAALCMVAVGVFVIFAQAGPLTS